jgi:hypothetical protein
VNVHGTPPATSSSSLALRILSRSDRNINRDSSVAPGFFEFFMISPLPLHEHLPIPGKLCRTLQ